MSDWGDALMRAKVWERAYNLLSRARAEWPLFTELEPAIKALMVAYPSLDLREAYERAASTLPLKPQPVLMTPEPAPASPAKVITWHDLTPAPGVH